MGGFVCRHGKVFWGGRRRAVSTQAANLRCNWQRLKGSYAINDRLFTDHHTDSDAASFTQIRSLAIFRGVRVIFTRQEDLSHQSRVLVAKSRGSTRSSRRNKSISITAGTQVIGQTIASA
ncbi:MAG TPA: hypothetical protein DEF45_06160 [Rhodopirellula sp.]|nr:hypothetical protein [Rhodopirellula sp.]